MRRIRIISTALAALGLLLLGAALSGCESCNPRRLRRYGSTCGQDSECAGGVCYRGRCTKSCAIDGDCPGGICIESVCQDGDDDYDGDGLSNAIEIQYGLDPTNADTDGDGLLDKQEVGLGAAPKDSNGDGIPDALQSNILDSDGDCMVDAIDSAPNDGKTVNLPAAEKICFVGICADHLSDVEVTCRKDAPTYEGIVLGCVGCGCQIAAAVAPDFQPVETACDGIDNDCDGLTDDAMQFSGKPLGEPCFGIYGICALAGEDGKVPSGIVECGTDKTPTCSVHGNGSASVAEEERCNKLDDDCDGATDEGFSWTHDGKTLAVGASCDCGAKQVLCPDGSNLGADVVGCGSDGSTASCSLQPFEAGSQPSGAIAPLTRMSWSAAAPPGWGKIVLYSGAIPTSKALVQRAERWELPLGVTATEWSLADEQAPGARADAAVVADPDGDRVLIVGGQSDTSGGVLDRVFALAKDGTFSDLSLATDASRVLPLPDGVAGAATRAVVVGKGSARKLVVFAAGKKPLWAPLETNSPAWIPLQLPAAQAGVAPLDGAPACVASAHASSPGVAVALSAASDTSQAGVFVLSDGGNTPLVVYVASTQPPPGRLAMACAVDAKGALLVAGGHPSGGETTAAFDVATFDQPLPSVKTAAWTQTAPEWSARSGATLLSATTIAGQSGLWLLGGHRVQSVAGGGHARVSLTNVLRVDGSAAVVADVPTPLPRVGAAFGRWNGHGVCFLAGATFELPKVGSATGRVVPVRDAWCHDKGAWTKVADNLAPWAFGIGGVDHVTGVATLASGVDFAAGELPALHKLWETGLVFKVGEPVPDRPKPTSAVWKVTLATGKASQYDIDGPLLAFPSVTYDAQRRRLIAYGGIDAELPTEAFWTLDLKTNAWTDVAKDYDPGDVRPLPSYGSLIAYAPVQDVLILIGGFNYQLSDGPPYVSYHVSEETVAIDECHGNTVAPTWAVSTLSSPNFLTLGVKTFAETTTSPPSKPLIRLSYGRPSLVPLLFDSVGMRGVTAIQDVGPYASLNGDGSPCTNAPASPILQTPIELNLALGRCDNVPRLFPEADGVPNLPHAMVLAAGVYDDTTRTSWLLDGVAADGALGGRFWRLDQTCAPSSP